MILTVEQARSLAAASMMSVGHTTDEAAIIADHLIDCELRGLSFGGLPRALSIVERMGQVRTPRMPISIVHETPVSATLHGGDQVGYLVGHRATDLAIEKARAFGIAVVGAYETWYTGMYAYYLERVTKAGFVGMIAGSAPPRVAPAGGTEGRFGTNPIAIGIPTTGMPVIWDIGTSAVMSGEVMLRRRTGVPLDEGWAYDARGGPTLDPAAALSGAFTVWGGHKGSGLAMIVQMLGMMSGAAAMPPVVRDCGLFLLVIDPALLGPAHDYRQRVADYAETLRATRPLDADKPVRVPFERSAAERARRLQEDRLDVPDEVIDGLRRLNSNTETVL